MKGGLLCPKSLLVGGSSETKSLAFITHSFTCMEQHSELYNQIDSTGNVLYYTVHLFFFHEENNFQNKSKADADICMILEQSVT